MKYISIALVAMMAAVSANSSPRLIVQATTDTKTDTKTDDTTKPDGTKTDTTKKDDTKTDPAKGDTTKTDTTKTEEKSLVEKILNPNSAVTFGATMTTSVALTAALYMWAPKKFTC